MGKGHRQRTYGDKFRSAYDQIKWSDKGSPEDDKGLGGRPDATDSPGLRQPNDAALQDTDVEDSSPVAGR